MGHCKKKYVQFIKGARFRKNADIKHRSLRLTAAQICSQTKVNGNEMLPYLFNYSNIYLFIVWVVIKKDEKRWAWLSGWLCLYNIITAYSVFSMTLPLEDNMDSDTPQKGEFHRWLQQHINALDQRGMLSLYPKSDVKKRCALCSWICTRIWKCAQMVQTRPTKSTQEEEYWRIASNRKTL